MTPIAHRYAKPVAKSKPKRKGGSSRKATPQSRRPAASARPARRKATSPADADDSALRAFVANYSRGPVVYLSRLPQFLIPALMVLLMVVGLAAPVVFAVLALLVVVAFISWLAFLSWPVLTTPQRAMRVVAISLVVLAAVGRIVGWF